MRLIDADKLHVDKQINGECWINQKQILEALSAEPCEDAISRKEALMALTGMNLPNDNAKLVAIFGERIRNLPPVKVEPQEWISVKDRLPDIGEEVLVSYFDGDVTTNTLTLIQTINDAQTVWKYGGGVIAWMPLPSPYKGE